MAVTSTTAEKKSDLKSAAVGFAVGSLLIKNKKELPFMEVLFFSLFLVS